MLGHLFELMLTCTLLGISWCFGKKCTCGGGTPPVNCTIFSDDFDRSDSTNLGSNWTETAGDSTIDSGTLKFTTTNAKATCNTNSPNPERVITVKAKASNANNLAYVFIDSYKVEVRFSTTAGRVRILDGGGSAVATSRLSNLNIPLNTLVTIRVCYNGMTLRAHVVGVTTSYVGAPATISGLTNGLGTGGTVSGSVAFDDWTLKDYDPPDCQCPFTPSDAGGGDHGCVYCTNFQGPYYWQVELDGVTDAICHDCDANNGLYLLTPATNPNCFPVNDNTQCCCWKSPNGPDPWACSPPNSTTPQYPYMTLQVCEGGDGFANGMRVRLYKSASGGLAFWQTIETVPIDCVGKSGESISLTSAISFNACDFAAATLTVSAL